MPHVRDRAICLRKLDYSETSQILGLFARETGLLTVIAKGAKRHTKAGASKYDGGLDLLDLGDAVFIHNLEKDMSTLTEWSLSDGHLALRDNLRALYLGQYLAELLSNVFEEGDPHPEVFDDLATLLPKLTQPDAESAALTFILRLLWIAGLFPELRRCAGCGAQSPASHTHFSPGASAVICPNCLLGYPDHLVLTAGTVPLLRALAGNSLPRAANAPLVAFKDLPLAPLARAEADPAHRLLLAHLRHTLAKDLRLAPYIVT